MKIIHYRTRFIEILTPIYDEHEARNFFYLILQDLKGLSKLDLALNPEIEMTEEEKNTFEEYLEKLKNHQPIQYLLGSTEFYGLTFDVNPNVLIPRPETEELVDWIISENHDKPRLSILDIGTGSGCIAISLAKHLKAEVTAFDISEKALTTAQTNADKNQTFVHFVEFDILNDLWQGDPFDCIVSNPPYVKDSEKNQMKANVLEHEPSLALFVPDENALVFYEKIAVFAKENLNSNGHLFFEINQYHGAEVMAMLKEKGFKDIQLKKDIYQNDRMILAVA
ncbi:MAG TPA: peptide chain release factor N(5)-glutamine methyltransferase [Flavobacterium sp.]|nr:peptide chain release factor N(5)-glutamine methyltransferase [Flavobacterium sp.]